MVSVSASYVVDEAVFSLFFFAMAVAFFVQLLVERQAEYDYRQITQHRKVQEWRPIEPRRSAQKGRADRGRASPPSSQRPSLAGQSPLPTPSHHSTKPQPISGGRHTESADSQEETDSVSVQVAPVAPALPVNPNAAPTVSADKQTNSGRVNRGMSSPPLPVAETHTRSRPRLRVGPIQWYLHRICLLMSVIECIRMVDPYSVHGIYPFYVVALLHHNCVALIYCAAVLAFFFPLHLIRIVALSQRSPVLKYLGVTMCVFAIILANLVPIAYGVDDYRRYPRGVFNLYIMVSIAVTSVVFNVYVVKVTKALNELIAFRRQSVGGSGYNSAAGSKRPSFVSPPITLNANPMESNREDPEDPNNRSSPSHSPSSSPHILPLPPIPSLQQFVSVDTLTLTASSPANAAATAGGVGAVSQSNSADTITSASSSTDSMGSFPALSPPASGGRISSGHTTASSSTDSLPSAGASSPSTQQLISPVPVIDRLPSVSSHEVTLTITERVGTVNKPTALTQAAALQSEQPTAFTRSRRPSDPVSRGYVGVTRSLRRFQISSNLVVLGACVLLAILGGRDLAVPNELLDLPTPNSFSNAVPVMSVTVILAACLVIAYWYSYMPISVLWDREDLAPVEIAMAAPGDNKDNKAVKTDHEAAVESGRSSSTHGSRPPTGPAEACANS